VSNFGLDTSSNRLFLIGDEKNWGFDEDSPSFGSVGNGAVNFGGVEAVLGREGWDCSVELRGLNLDGRGLIEGGGGNT
jgi:hypothetical protein